MLPPIPLTSAVLKQIDHRKFQQSPTSLVQALSTYNTGIALENSKIKY